MKIKAAIIGSGIGIKHLEAINNYKQSVVKYICEKNILKIPKLKKKYPKIRVVSNDREIFKDRDINLVSIASFDDYHFSQILKCIKFNKNIIVEKPMCLKLNELIKIYSLIKKKKNIKITSNLVLRTNSLFLKLKKKINIKKIFYIEADYIWGRPHKLLEWRSKINDYSIILGAGIHVIDLVMWFLGSRPTYVQAFANKLATSDTVFKKNSLALMILEFPNNVLVKISVNAAGIYKHFHELKIFQTDKSFVHSFSKTFSFEKKDNNILLKSIKSNYPDKINRKKLIQNFINALQNKHVRPLFTFKEQIDLMTTCFAAEESLLKNKKIKIKYL